MNEPTLTAHSEYLPLQTVWIRRPGDAAWSKPSITSQWKALNYLAPPEPGLAREHYAAFETQLRKEVPEVLTLAADSPLSLDSVYCRDASIATDHGMILCRMGKPERSGEPALHREVYEREGIPILGAIEAPGTLEGGDVAWLGPRLLAVGHSYRTNQSGIDQLAALLHPKGVEVLPVDLPHFRGPADVFHLMSILSPVDRDLAVVYTPLMPIGFLSKLKSLGFGLVEVPEAEFDTLGSNVLALAPRRCLLAAGNPKTEAALRKAGCQVVTYCGNEISLKGGGGPTCLTRPMWRMSPTR